MVLSARKASTRSAYKPDATLKLPSEILSYIFEEYIEAQSYPTAEPPRPWNPTGKQPPRFFFAPEAKVTLRLGSICRRWRDVAWAHCRLWATLAIRVDATVKHPNAHKNGPELVSQWLERAGKLPLRIRLKHSGTMTAPDRNPRRIALRSAMPREISMAIVRKISIYSSRWHSLDLVGLPFDMLNELGAGTGDEEISILKNIAIIGNSTPEQSPTPLWKGFSNRHRPTCISFAGAFCPTTFDLDWTAVSHLYAESSLRVDSARWLLESVALSSITHLALSGFCFMDYPSVELKHLANLTIFDSPHGPNEAAAALCDSLTVPSLKRLRYASHEKSPKAFPVFSLIALVQRSGCSVDALVLEFPLITDEELVLLLKCMPSITYLKSMLREENNSAVLFICLSPHYLEVTGFSILPLLKRCEVLATAPKPWKTLISVFHPHHPPSEQSGDNAAAPGGGIVLREDLMVLLQLRKEPNGEIPYLETNDLMDLLELWLTLRCMINVDDDYDPTWAGDQHIFVRSASQVLSADDPDDRPTIEYIAMIPGVQRRLWRWIKDGGPLPISRPAFNLLQQEEQNAS